MFFSVIQTLVCVLLVNGGLYALHLTGNSNGPSMAQQTSNNNQPHNTNPLSKTSSNPYQSTNNRFNEELADLAQLERERLMVMGLVKQTAEESGYHGRPIITGRIKMHPAEDIDSDYSAWLSQQARNAMFGSVVTQPLNDEEDYDTGGGGGVENFDPLRSQNKYEYGRVVQPVEREREFENPHNLNLDDFMELEQANEEEDMFPDLDGYAYIDELMAEENKERLQHHYQQQQQQIPQFPGFRPHLAQQHQQHQQQQHQQHSLPLTHSYQNQDPLDNTQTLKEFFEKEQLQKLQQHPPQHPSQHPPQHSQQHQQQLQQQHQTNPYNPKYRNDIRMQQKWLRKRNQLQQQQQPEQLPRNIFGQKNSKQLHHFRTLNNNKLAMANSEATATTRVNNNNKSEQQQDQQHQEKEITKEDSKKSSQSSSSSSSSSSSPNTTKKSEKSLASSLIEPKADLLLHPNHKRSGLTPASLASTQGVSSPHSLASQLMLRTARGQRQYDVPQIECPTAMDGMERFACPTPDVQGRYRCIDDHVLCDGFIDCPEGEDEDRRSCMFYKTTKAHLDVLADALLRWARGR